MRPDISSWRNVVDAWLLRAGVLEEAAAERFMAVLCGAKAPAEGAKRATERAQ